MSTVFEAAILGASLHKADATLNARICMMEDAPVLQPAGTHRPGDLDAPPKPAETQAAPASPRRQMMRQHLGWVRLLQSHWQVQGFEHLQLHPQYMASTRGRLSGVVEAQSHDHGQMQ